MCVCVCVCVCVCEYIHTSVLGFVSEPSLSLPSHKKGSWGLSRGKWASCRFTKLFPDPDRGAWTVPIMKWNAFSTAIEMLLSRPRQASPVVLTPRTRSSQMLWLLKVFPSFYFKQLALWLGPSPGCLHLWAAEGVPARLTAFLQAMAAQGLNPAAPCSQRPRSEAGPGPASSPLRAHTVRSPVQAILGMPRLEWFIYLSTPVSGSFQVPESWTQKNTTFLPLKMTGREPNIKPRDIFPINVRQRFIILLQK